MNQIDLKNKVAVVTGGAQGIGLSIAKLFLDSGASVSLWDQDEKLVNETAHKLSSLGRVEAIVTDVSDLSSVNNATLQTQKSLGGIDILICNAGISGPNEKLWNYPPEAWQKIMDINLTGVFNCLSAVTPLMIENNYGRIVNVASIWSQITKPERALYTTAKTGMIGFTRALAVEYAPWNVLVNAVSPGFTCTELTKQSLSANEMKLLSKQIPLQRFANTDEIALAVLFLCSDLNSYITGQNITIDGGYTLV